MTGWTNSLIDSSSAWLDHLTADQQFVLFSAIKVVGAFCVVMPIVAYAVLAERKVSAAIQDRHGPNRVGWFGIWQPVADGVKAVVNDRAITFAEVEEYTRPAVDSLRRQYSAQPDVFQQKLNEALNDSLEQLVERQLILHSFDTEGYKLPDSVVDQLVQERIRERFGDRVTLLKTLQAQGMTFDQFRKQIRDEVGMSQLQ